MMTNTARPKPSLGQWWAMVKQAAAAWSKDYAPSMGAALSYYTVFSLAPLLLLVISIAGLLFGQDAARGALFGQLNSLMGADAAKAVEGLLASVSKPSEGIVGTVVGIALLLFGATTVFGEVQDAVDRIWRAPARDEKGGLWGLLRTRFLSFGMILGIAFLLMVSLVMGAAISALGTWWGPAFGGWEFLAQVVTFVVGFALTTGVFAMIYKLMPRVRVEWRDVWIGAAATSLLFNVGRFFIGLYIGKSSIASGFGAAGSLIIVFVWVYYSAQIFLMGAELTWVYARTFESIKQKVEDESSKNNAVPSREADSPPATAAMNAEAAEAAPMRASVPPASLASAVTALVVGLAIRYVIPRLFRKPR